MVDQLESAAQRLKSCSRCGEQFRCSHADPGERGCWCESFTLGGETLRELSVLADDCLCPPCLGGFAKRDRREAPGATANQDLLQRAT